MKTRYFSEYDREINGEKGLNEVINVINENVIANGLKYAVMCEHILIAEAQETEKEFIINIIDDEVAKEIRRPVDFLMYFVYEYIRFISRELELDYVEIKSNKDIILTLETLKKDIEKIK